jgi:hypothetical protein
VYENDTQLTLGQDYLISFDAGQNWFNSIAFDTSSLDAILNARSGRFRVKLLSVNPVSSYWCEYQIAKHQKLGNTDLVSLVQGVPEVGDRYSGLELNSNFLLIARSIGSDQLTTPVLNHYVLKVA